MLGDHPIHPVLLATDLGAARDFYHDRLGLEILSESVGLPRFDGQGRWLGQATCLTISSSVVVSNSLGVR
jgi:catechol 2,3-dioxygenase-like lactoylglutathione lyase family enzyme